MEDMRVYNSEENTTHSKGTHVNHADTYGDTKQISCFKYILKPILIALALCGCYNLSDINYLVKGEQGRRVTVRFVLSIVYRLLFLSAPVVLAVKCAITASISPERRFVSILVFTWLLNCVVSILVFFKQSSRKYGNLENSFKHWEEHVLKEYNEIGIECPIPRIKQRVLISSVIAMVLAVLNAAIVGVQIAVVPFEVFVYPFDVSAWSSVLAVLMMLMASMVWLVPQAYCAALSGSLTQLFGTFNTFFEKQIEDNKNSVPENFNKLRILHLNVCRLTDELDKDLRWFLASNFGFLIFLTLFILYQLLRTNLDWVSLIMFCFWCVVELLILFTSASLTAAVNVAVSIVNLLELCRIYEIFLSLHSVVHRLIELQRPEKQFADLASLM